MYKTLYHGTVQIHGLLLFYFLILFRALIKEKNKLPSATQWEVSHCPSARWNMKFLEHVLGLPRGSLPSSYFRICSSPRQPSQEVLQRGLWFSQLTPIGVKDLQPALQAPSDSHAVMEDEAICPEDETNFGHACPGFYSFCYCPKPVTTGEG